MAHTGIWELTTHVALFSSMQRGAIRHSVGIYVSEDGVRNKFVLRRELVGLFIVLAIFHVSGSSWT